MKPRSVESCAAELQRRGFADAGIARRREIARSIQEEKRRRDLEDYTFSHFAFPPEDAIDNENLLFEDKSGGCVLTPEVDGLGHFIAGEQIRSDIAENQAGVPMKLEIQIIDTRNCQPIPDVYLEVYHCNATGVYSGVQAQGNGNADDASNLDATFGRGIQQTDSNGVVTFNTIFPGHYYGVAPHIHILTHSSNDPVIAPTDDGIHVLQATHNGRIFFDQDLINSVESQAPYHDNTQPLTLNQDDPVLTQEAEVTDPYVKYVLLGQGGVQDGILAWITVGVDPSVVHPMQYEGNGRAGNGGAGVGLRRG